MTNLFSILKINLYNVFGINKALHSKNKNDKKKVFITLTGIAALGALILFAIFMYNFMFAEIFGQIGLMNVQFGIMFAVSCLLTLIFTISLINGTIFGFKDYDILMSFPIKHSTIITSRILILYFANIFFSIIIMIPATIVYGIVVAPSIFFYIRFIATLLFVPLVPIIVSTIIGTVVSIIASKTRFKNLISTIFYFVVFLGLFFLMSGTSFTSTGDSLEEVGVMIINTINKIYPLTTMYLNGVCNGDIGSLLLFVLIPTVLFALFVLVISKYFTKINNALKSQATKNNYKMTKQIQTSQFSALFKKELKRFFSCPIYIFNCGFGMVLLAIVTILALVFRSDALAMLTQIPEGIPITQEMIFAIAPYFMAFFVITCTISACSLSLEGKNLWILQSSPISTYNILMAKVSVNLIVTAPLTVICTAIIAIAFKATLPQALLFVLVPTLFCILTSFFGLYCNLLLPNFTWETEVVVVKQSLSVVVAVFGLMFLMAVPIILFFSLDSLSILIRSVICLSTLILFNILFVVLVRTHGIKLFNKL